MRGSSRGNSKSFFGSLFESDNIDDGMAEMNTSKCVGFFKGRIDVYNVEERINNNLQKKEIIDEIFSNLDIIYEKDHPGESLPFKVEDLDTREKLERLMTCISRMGFEEHMEQL